MFIPPTIPRKSGSGRLALAAALAAMPIAGCATAPTGLRAAPLASAATQPLRDLNLARRDPIPILEQAARAPYAPPSPMDCATLGDEVLVLDAALGPDLDQPVAGAAGPGLVQDLAEMGIREVVGLPYRGAIRRVTGAEARDREARRLILAGSIRRAYLKGVAHALGCGKP